MSKIETSEKETPKAREGKEEQLFQLWEKFLRLAPPNPELRFVIKEVPLLRKKACKELLKRVSSKEDLLCIMEYGEGSVKLKAQELWAEKYRLVDAERNKEKYEKESIYLKNRKLILDKIKETKERKELETLWQEFLKYNPSKSELLEIVKSSELLAERAGERVFQKNPSLDDLWEIVDHVEGDIQKKAMELLAEKSKRLRKRNNILKKIIELAESF